MPKRRARSGSTRTSFPVGESRQLARLHRPLGRRGHADPQSDRAQSHGLSGWFHAALGKEHYRKREFQKALVEFKTMNLPDWWWNQVELAYTYGQLGDTPNARKATARLLELYPGFDLEKAVLEHRKFSFEQSYIDLAVDGLRKAGVPEKSP
jgi:Flp pilus assembly protein TadD